MQNRAKTWADELLADEAEAFADFVAFICDDPAIGRKSPLLDRPTGTGIPLAKLIAAEARRHLDGGSDAE